MINDLEKELVINNDKVSLLDSKLAGKSIIFTGTLARTTRAEAKKRCEEIGMKVVGRNALKSTGKFTYNIDESLYAGVPMRYYTGNNNTYATVTASFTNKSNSQVAFHNWPLDINLSDFVVSNSTRLVLTPTNGYNIDSKIVSVDDSSNTVTLEANTWLTFGNVATVTAESGSNAINITALTGQYDMMNSGFYSNTAYPLMDIVYAGDKVLVANNTSKH